MSKKLLFFALLSFFSSIANAYDFEVDNIYYSITSKTDKTCAVDDNGTENTYSGNITIPAKVIYNENEYTVTCNDFYQEWQIIRLYHKTWHSCTFCLPKWK